MSMNSMSVADNPILPFVMTKEGSSAKYPGPSSSIGLGVVVVEGDPPIPVKIALARNESIQAVAIQAILFLGHDNLLLLVYNPISPSSTPPNERQRVGVCAPCCTRIIFEGKIIRG
jgi:hypothetical protein